MVKKNTTPKTRVHIWLDQDVNNKLHLYFDNSIGYSAAINNILKLGIKRMEERALANATPVVPTGEELTHE